MTTSTNLPAGVSQNTFNQAVSEYSAIVGNDNVFVYGRKASGDAAGLYRRSR